ncbi:MAG TPA: hypothetical protein DDW26_06230, partial [Rhizobiales bacterium]|nr:hypothetical protein [Hyphomicrobiales bacterium]
AKQLDRRIENAGDRQAIESFYAGRNYAPLWIRDGELTARAKDVIARLKGAADEGLDAADYPVPDFAAATTPEALAEAELKLTASMLDYARQAQSGRMHWSQVSADILYPDHPTDPSEVLANVTTAKDASAVLDSYNPPQKLYRELKAKLAELRGQGDGPVTQISDGPALKFTPARSKKQPAVEMEDARVPQLRAKLGITENADDTHYDARVAGAVRKFQEGAELKPTGILDDKTVKAINSPKRDRQIDTVIVNMERWRWMPAELGSYHVEDNIPEFIGRVVKNGKTVYATKVVVGLPKYATPIFSADMRSIVFNPEWVVPETIKLEDLQPALRGGGFLGADTSILRDHELTVSYQGKPVDAGTVDWSHANILQYTFTQPPGPDNVLGTLKFNFPNKHAIYMHDTIQPEVFDETVRMASHGCIRVYEPARLAALLLAEDKGWSAQQVKDMLAKGNNSVVSLRHKVPVHVTYFTATVDEKGKVQAFADIYGLDSKMGSALFGKATKFDAVATEEAAASGGRKRSAWNSGRGGLTDAISGLFGN